MDGKKCVLATVTVFVLYFLLSGFFYAFLMKDWFEGQSLTPGVEPNMVWITVMCLVYAGLMAYTFPKGYRGGTAVSEGAKFGVLFALIAWLPSSLAMHAMGQCTIMSVVVSMIWEIAMGALLGIVVAKLYGAK